MSTPRMQPSTFRTGEPMRYILAFLFLASSAFAQEVTYPYSSSVGGGSVVGAAYTASNNLFTGSNQFSAGVSIGAGKFVSNSITNDNSTTNHGIAVSPSYLRGGFLADNMRFVDNNGFTGGVYMAGQSLYVGNPMELRMTFQAGDVNLIYGQWEFQAQDDPGPNRPALQGWATSTFQRIFTGVTVTQKFLGTDLAAHTNIYVNGVLISGQQFP